MIKTVRGEYFCKIGIISSLLKCAAAATEVKTTDYSFCLSFSAAAVIQSAVPQTVL
jgi:hypothetical protein